MCGWLTSLLRNFCLVNVRRQPLTVLPFDILSSLCYFCFSYRDWGIPQAALTYPSIWNLRAPYTTCEDLYVPIENGFLCIYIYTVAIYPPELRYPHCPMNLWTVLIYNELIAIFASHRPPRVKVRTEIRLSCILRVEKKIQTIKKKKAPHVKRIHWYNPPRLCLVFLGVWRFVIKVR